MSESTTSDLVLNYYDRSYTVTVRSTSIDNQGVLVDHLSLEERLSLIDDIEQSIDGYVLTEDVTLREGFVYDVVLLYHLGDDRVMVK